MSATEDKRIIEPIGSSNKIAFELKVFISLAIPIYFSQLATHATGVIAAMMTGNYSTVDQAAVATGNMLFWPVFFGLGGSLFIVTAYVAQYYGAKKHDQIGPLLKQAFWLCIPLIILVSLYLAFADNLLNFFKTPMEVQKITKNYLLGLMVGTPALFLFQPLKSFSEGITRPLPITIINLGMVTLSAFLNYVLIFGKFGFPELGGTGCGISFAVSAWSALIALTIYIYFSKPYKKANLFKNYHSPDLNKIKEIFKLGFPIGACIFVEFGLFSGSGLLLSNLGENTIASHAIAMQVTTVTFMLPLSIGLAAAVRSGNLLGAGEFIRARFSSFFAIIIAVTLACFNFILLYNFGTLFASYFNTDPAVITLSGSLIFIAAFMQISDGISFTGQGALRGYKDTLAPLYIMIIAFWCFGLPIGYILGLTDILLPSQGAKGMWIGLCFGVLLASLLVFLRLDKTTKIAINDKNFKVF
jgi:MATE family multidrug resistance protein